MSGPLTHSPSQIMQYWLVDQSLGTLASAAGSWPIVCGEEPDETTGRASQIFIAGTEGQLQGRSMLDGYVFEKHGLQIRVRDTRYEDGRTKAQAIATALDAITLDTTTISSSTYILALFDRTGSLLELGKEPGTTRHLFALNGYLVVRESS